jgi:hypothetical protein
MANHEFWRGGGVLSLRILFSVFSLIWSSPTSS